MQNIYIAPVCTADIACCLTQVLRKKVDGVLVWEEHVTDRLGHHRPDDGGGGHELSCPAQPPPSGGSNDRMAITSRLCWEGQGARMRKRKSEFNVFAETTTGKSLIISYV